jgi:hypothetical protein
MAASLFGHLGLGKASISKVVWVKQMTPAGLRRPAKRRHLVSIFKLMLTCWRLSNWLTVLMSLLRPLNWA